MHVADRMSGLIGQPAAVADVEPAGEADRAVDDENLAVIAEVCVGEIDRHRGGKEPRDSHPLLCQHADDGGPRVPRADAVDEHADGDASLRGAGERGGEAFSRWVIVEDVGRHPDATGRGVDRGEHPRIGLVATDKWLDGIAFDERPAGHLADEPGQRPQGRVGRADGVVEPLD